MAVKGTIEAARSGGWLSWHHVAILVALSCLVYANTLQNSYHLDDNSRIVNNPEIDRFWPPARHFFDPATSSILPQVTQFRPLLPLSLSVDRAFADALGFDRLVVLHVANVLIHIAGTLLVYLLFRILLQRSPAPPLPPQLAMVAALLYAIHPVSGVPVNYLCSRDLLLMQLFFVGSLVAYVGLEGPRRWALHMGLLVLSLFSKTNGVAMPLILVAYELSFGSGRLRDRATWLRPLPAAAVVLGFFAWTELFLDFSDAGQLFVDRSRLEFPLTQLKLHIVFYLRNFFWAFWMRPLPQLEPVQTIWNAGSALGLVLVVGSLGAAWHLRRRLPLAAFAIAAYWGMFSPTASVLPFRLLATDYRQYAPLPWACLLLALALFVGLRRRERLRTAAVVLALAWFVGSSIAMNRVWANEETLWGHSVKLGGATMAHHNYARAISGRDRALAEHHYREALRLAGGNVYSQINLGLVVMADGRHEEGLAEVAKAVHHSPTWAMPHYWYANALKQVGRAEEAASESARAADLLPRNRSYVYQAAADAYAIRDHEGALRQLEVLHRLHGSHKDSRFLEAFTLQRMERREEAVAAYGTLLAEQPQHVQGHFNVAYALLKLERCEEAISEFERTLELDPDYLESHLHLSRCHQRLGHSELADRHAAGYEARPR